MRIVLSYFIAMIDLDSPRWSSLLHCYGPATNLPSLLRQLETFPASQGNTEPWFTLWSSLCHQGDVFPASFAAVPHIVRVLSTDPTRATSSFFQLPACVEIARTEHHIVVPEDLKGPYAEALRQLPHLVAAASVSNWSDDFLSCALAAIAAAKGYPGMGEAILELNENTSAEFLEWRFNR